jgi:hypothetical protein
VGIVAGVVVLMGAVAFLAFRPRAPTSSIAKSTSAAQLVEPNNYFTDTLTLGTEMSEVAPEGRVFAQSEDVYEA